MKRTITRLFNSQTEAMSAVTELEQAGISFPEHDARYAYGTEWLAVAAALMRGEHLTYKGKHLNVPGYQLRPASKYRAAPRIYIGGESEPAR